MITSYRTYSAKLNEYGNWEVDYSDEYSKDTIIAAYGDEATANEQVKRLTDAEPMRYAAAYAADVQREKEYRAIMSKERLYNTLETYYQAPNRYFGD